MKFSDIDFSALGNMMANMSDEEKDRLNDYAKSMMDKMNTQETTDEGNDESFYDYLEIKEEDYNHLPGRVLDCLESASDLEEYYEDVEEADYSASVLFYGKAFLTMLRTYHFSIYRDVLEVQGFSNPNTTTLYSYLVPLMQDENIQKLIDNEIGSGYDWYDHKLALQQVYTLLNRAEYDFISIQDLENIKYLLLKEKALLKIENLI